MARGPEAGHCWNPGRLIQINRITLEIRSPKDLAELRGALSLLRRDLRHVTGLNKDCEPRIIILALDTRHPRHLATITSPTTCLLYTSDAADEEDSVDLGGRRIIKKKKKKKTNNSNN
eukprot:TRINITY_DN7869_c0_g1_i11.p1 TRINITY_DN7869_c0_g1~~TRINITY_DN7869_c0_g1_i11.p1  ORF type:complete len:118 (-),score=10.03 TRINITY_DN7869_c0_g1_i11:24-377(-)